LLHIIPMPNKEILFIVQLPKNVSPGQRFRCELYEDLLQKNGFNTTTEYFLDRKGYEIFYKPGFVFAKFIAVIKGSIRRKLLLFKLKKYNYIFIQREASPIGLPFFEWIVSKILHKKIIYDFDDAIWIPHISEQNKLAAIFKNSNKVKQICRWAYKVSCGNNYLCNYAKQFNEQVVYNPTCVDTDHRYNIIANHDVERVTIGWTGSFSTVHFLDMVQPALKKLQEKYDFNIKVICNKEPVLDLKNITYVEWTEENEISELAGCQIGLMPLTDDEWNKGKCGFKLIQYLALEIPAVSSSIGVNKIIIEEGINGFFSKTEDDWYAAIEKLIRDPAVRKQMGKAGRKKITEEYSLSSNANNFLSLFADKK
jgi:glycosyltransferase involved in cell wall biosynthesis